MSSPHETLSLAARQAAWKNFTRTGDPHFLRDLPKQVAESWLRSWQHGVDPILPGEFRHAEHQAPHNEQTQRLLRIAQPLIHALDKELASSSLVLYLADRDGWIVYREGNTKVLYAADQINSVPGARATENVAGTNGLGTALFLREPIQLDLSEHFCESFFDWAGVGVPILHPLSHELVAVADLVQYQKSLTPELTLLAKAIVAGIQSRLLEHESTLQRGLLEEFLAKSQKPGATVLAVDRNGIIVSATPSLAQRLHLSSEQLCGRSLSFLPELHTAMQEAATRNEPREALLSGVTSERLGKVAIEPLQRQGESAGALLYFSSPPMSTRVELRKVGESSRWTARYTFADLLGVAPLFHVALQRAQRVAPTDLPVFLQGETGTGKDLLAHAIHHVSPRREGPFVAVNCGALPPDLIAAELFGYEKGAFTGAVTSGKRGKLELAHGGTIFLDEITETSPAFQVSLLRALHDQEILPVGGEQPIRIDVRVIAASNRNVHALIQQGTFRSDLYYRLNGVTITLPPLRERQDDIPLLAQHFLKETHIEKSLSAEVRAALQQYQWPGNLRELRTVLQAAAVLATGAIIQVADLPPEVCAVSGRNLYTPAESGEPSAARAIREAANGRTTKEIDPEALLAALRAHHGNAKQAAKELGIARSSLYRKLSEFGLTRSWAQGERR